MGTSPSNPTDKAYWFDNYNTLLKYVNLQGYGQSSIVTLPNQPSSSPLAETELVLKQCVVLPTVNQTASTNNNQQEYQIPTVLARYRECKIETLPQLLKYRIQGGTAKGGLCSSNAKTLQCLFQYDKNTLKDQLELRKRAKASGFTEGEVVHLIDCLLSGLVVFRNNNIKFQQLSIQNILKSTSGVYKLCIIGEILKDEQMVVPATSQGINLTTRDPHTSAVSTTVNHGHDYQKSKVFNLGLICLECLTLRNDFAKDHRSISQTLRNLEVSDYTYRVLEAMLEEKTSDRANYERVFELNSNVQDFLDRGAEEEKPIVHSRAQKQSQSKYNQSKISLVDSRHTNSRVKPGKSQRPPANTVSNVYHSILKSASSRKKEQQANVSWGNIQHQSRTSNNSQTVPNSNSPYASKMTERLRSEASPRQRQQQTSNQEPRYTVGNVSDSRNTHSSRVTPTRQGLSKSKASVNSKIGNTLNRSKARQIENIMLELRRQRQSLLSAEIYNPSNHR